MDAAPLITLPLLLAIALGNLGMLLPIMLRILGMSLAPLLLAVANDLRVLGIRANFYAMIVAAATTLAFGVTTNALLWTINRRLKDLLTVGTTSSGQHARLLDLSSAFVEKL